MGRKHGINFEAGNPNNAAGNCLYESLQDNINTRSCFTENLDNEPEFYRYVWNIEGEKKAKLNYQAHYTEEEWEQGWKLLQNTDTYEFDYFGDLAIAAAAHCLRKDILVINTPWQMRDSFATSPVYVICSDSFDPSNVKNNDIPPVLFYNGFHYESGIPVTDDDVQKTVELVAKYKNGEYVIPRGLTQSYKRR